MLIRASLWAQTVLRNSEVQEVAGKKQKGKRHICRLAECVRHVADLNNILREQRRKVGLWVCPGVQAIFSPLLTSLKTSCFHNPAGLPQAGFRAKTQELIGIYVSLRKKCILMRFLWVAGILCGSIFFRCRVSSCVSSCKKPPHRVSQHLTSLLSLYGLQSISTEANPV